MATPEPLPEGDAAGDEPDDVDDLLRAWFAAEDATPQQGSRIDDDFGSYRLLEPLGRGGMGQVFLAEQLAPVSRRVALKILRAELGSPAAVARFRAEQQALARMNHDNIARVFDAGCSRSGRPFFVMEPIAGKSLRAHCDEARLSIVRRLGLFLDVCAGVQHAHDNGVLHRDLKPSNVLVAVQGDRATPKIIDFGLARAVDLPRGERASWSHTGAVAGTPNYMSPEQADGAGDLGPTTDIYSLGVMLYELLVGTLPLQDLDRDQPATAQRRIRSDDPVPPSRRLHDLGARASAIANDRDTTATALGEQLQGPLDWIVMRALQKEPQHRYASARLLAVDLQAWLAGAPTFACADRFGDRWRRWRRRHPDLHRGLWLGAMVGGLLVAALLTIWPMDGRAAATAPTVVAESTPNPAGEPLGVDPPALEAIDRPRDLPSAAQRGALEMALQMHRRRVEAGRNNPTVAAEVALAEVEIGDAQRRLGRPAEAQVTLTSAIAALDGLLASPGADAALRGHRGRGRDALGQLAYDRGETRESLDLTRAALADLFTAIASPGGAVFRRPLARACGHLVDVLYDLRQFNEALGVADDQIRLLEALAGNPDEAPPVAELVRAHYSRGLAHNGLGKFRAAKASMERAIAIADERAAVTALDREASFQCAWALRLLARLEQKMANQRDLGPAGDHARRAIAILVQLAATQPGDGDCHGAIAGTVYLLAEFARHGGDHPTALQHYQDGRQAARRALAIDAGNRRYGEWLTALFAGEAKVRIQSAQFDELASAARVLAGELPTAAGIAANTLSAISHARRRRNGPGDEQAATDLDTEAMTLLRGWVPTVKNVARQLINIDNFESLRERPDFNALAAAPPGHVDDRDGPPPLRSRWVCGRSSEQVEALVREGWRIVDFEIESTGPSRFAAALVADDPPRHRPVRWLGDTDKAGLAAARSPGSMVLDFEWIDTRGQHFACVLAESSGTGFIWSGRLTPEELLSQCGKHKARPWSITAVGDGSGGRMHATVIGNHQWDFREWRLSTGEVHELLGNVDGGSAVGDLVRWPDDRLTWIETKPAVANQQLALAVTAEQLAARLGDGAFRVVAFCAYRRDGQQRYDAVLNPDR